MFGRDEREGGAVKQIRVVDLVVLSGIALVLGALAPVHHVLLTAKGWFIVAGLLAAAAVIVVIASYMRWVNGLATERARADRR
jgi:hypothetical protein